MKTEAHFNHRHYQLIASAIRFIHEHPASHPSVQEIADLLAMNELQLQQTFSQWAGTTAQQCLQTLSKQVALEALTESETMLQTSLPCSLSRAGGSHDLIVSCESMTPAEIKLAGEGMVIEYACIETPFADALLAWTNRGICYLQFIQPSQVMFDDLALHWPNAQYLLNQQQGDEFARKIFSPSASGDKIHLLMQGTDFQLKVWQAMLTSKVGQRLSYAQVAQGIGNPRASRAVGTALGRNMIAYLIPCHRVIKSDGGLSNYRWGVVRKAAMLVWERVQYGNQ